MPPAARITDMHVCPMVTGVVPHVGGPILPPGCPTVLIGGLPAARVTDMATCVGPPDTIIMGSPTVLIGNLMAARIGDPTAHGGVIVLGCFTVMIGEAGAPAPSAPPPPSLPAVPTVPASPPSPSPSPAPSPKSAISLGLGTDVDSQISKSPKMTKMLQDLQSRGYKFEFGPKGGGTKCDKNAKKIIVDENEKGHTNRILSSLAHEGGHASYKEDPYVPPAGLTKKQYVDANVKRQLKDEGEATLTSIEMRDDLKAHGGPSIAVPGAKAAEYERVAAKYPDAKDRDTAREEIGRIFADKEQPSGSPSGTTYQSYYEKPYADYYDKLPAAQQTPAKK